MIRKRTSSVCDLLQKVTEENIARSNVDYIQEGVPTSDQAVLSNSCPASDGNHRSLRAKAVLIATGSRPFRPKQYFVRHPRSLRYRHDPAARSVSTKDIVIVGGGPVGVEFATICHVLGARVTGSLDRGTRLMPTMDDEMSAVHGRAIPEVGRTRAIRLDRGKHCGEGRWIASESVSEKVLLPDTVLFAAGRSANTDSLGLEAVGADL